MCRFFVWKNLLNKKTYVANKKNSVENALKSLKKEFVVVGKTRIRSWDAWLVVGFLAGAVLALILVANRSGEFDLSRADSTPGLVAHWSFDEVSGGYSSDSVSGIRGRLQKGATWISEGVANGAIHFGGQKNPGAFDVSSALLNFNNGFTMEAWVRSTAPSNYAAIFENRYLSPAIWIRPDQTLGLDVYDYSQARWHKTGNSQFPLNQWRHIVATYDKKELKLDVNVMLVQSTPLSALAQRGGTFRLGNDHAYDGYAKNYAFEGDIDELKIYNRALAADEVEGKYGVVNSADKIIFGMSMSRSGVTRTCVSISDADLDLWKSRGADGFMCGIPQMYRMGRNDDFTGDLSASLDEEKYKLQKEIIDSKIVERARARGLDLYFGFYLVNYWNSQTPLAEWFDDAEWQNLVIPNIRNIAAAAKALGFKGLLYDSELYGTIAASRGQAGPTWNWNYTGNTHSEAEVRAKVRERGAEVMQAILSGFPGVDILAYDEYLPETSTDMTHEAVNKIVNAFGTNTHIDFVDGLTSVEGYNSFGLMTEVFYKQAIYQYYSWDAVLQESANKLYSLLSRRLSNWDYASTRYFRPMFIWIDEPVPTSREKSSYTAARTPDYVANQLQMFRKWGEGGILNVYGQRFEEADFSYEPYVPGLQAASKPGVVDSEPPTLFINSTGEKVAPLAGRLAIGDRIRTNSTVNVMRDPYIQAKGGGVISGTEPHGTLGTIVVAGVAQPVSRGGSPFMYINYDDGATGWTEINLLERVSEVSFPNSFLSKGHVLNLSGYAYDNLAIKFVKWEDNRGNSGMAKMRWRAISGSRLVGYSIWRMDWDMAVPLEVGTNAITITASDIKGITSSRTINITRE